MTKKQKTIDVDEHAFILHYNNVLRPNNQQAYFLEADREYFSWIALMFCEETGIATHEIWETWVLSKVAAFKCFELQGGEVHEIIIASVMGVRLGYDIIYFTKGKMRELTIQTTRSNPPLYTFNCNQRDWNKVDIVLFTSILYEDKGVQVVLNGWGEWQDIKTCLMDSGKENVFITPYQVLESKGLVQKMVKLTEDQEEDG